GAEEVGPTSRGGRFVGLGESLEISWIALILDRDVLPLAGEGRIEKLACQVAARVWYHNKGSPKLTALRFVHGQGIGEFQRRGCLLPELPCRIVVGVARLRRKLDLELPRRLLHPFNFPLP